MKRNQLLLIPAVLSVLLLTSCSGLPNRGGGGTPPPPNATAVTFTMISQSQIRPGNFTILAWSATIDSISLNQTGGNATNLNITPVPVDFNRLSTDSLVLGNFTNIPTATFSTITMALSHFTITIHNESGGTVGTCPDQAICEFSPAPATVTIPSSLTVNPGKMVSVFFTIFPSNILSVSNAGLALSFTGNTPISEQSVVRVGVPANAVDTIEDLTGVVTKVSSGSITLMTGSGLTLAAALGSQVFHNDSPSGQCAAGTISCVVVGSIVSLDGNVNLNGSVTATEVDLLNTTSQDAVEGTIFATFGGFSLVVTDKQVMSTNATLTAANIGDIFTVSGLNAATYSIDTKTLSTVTAPPIPTNLFQSMGDLLNGQTVRLHVTAATGSAGANDQALTTDAVQLRWTRVTGAVNVAPAGSVIDVTGVGSIFQTPSQGSAMVQTYSPGTTLDNLGNLQALGGSASALISTRVLFLRSSPSFFAARVRAQ